jgi:hypothetical protein
MGASRAADKRAVQLAKGEEGRRQSSPTSCQTKAGSGEVGTPPAQADTPTLPGESLLDLLTRLLPGRRRFQDEGAPGSRQGQPGPLRVLSPNSATQWNGSSPHLATGGGHRSLQAGAGLVPGEQPGEGDHRLPDVVVTIAGESQCPDVRKKPFVYPGPAGSFWSA